MNRTHLRRSLAAVVTAIACLAGLAGPAGAVVHDTTVTGGVITLSSSVDVYDLAPATPTCPTGTFPTTLQIDVGTGTVGITAFGARSTTTYAGFPAWTNPHLRVLTAPYRTPGTLTGTGPYTITNIRLGVVVTVYNAVGYDATTCVVTGTPACAFSFQLSLSGTLTGTAPGATASLTGTSTTSTGPFPTCATPYLALLGVSAATTTPITATLTT